ncbi:hypothetical protein K530_54745 [Streptomyces noursei CCRC 11814]|nr:hypothetical protein K530_54745 [Streptomyces noursei CCRC 11814]
MAGCGPGEFEILGPLVGLSHFAGTLRVLG